LSSTKCDRPGIEDALRNRKSKIERQTRTEIMRFLDSMFPPK